MAGRKQRKKNYSSHVLIIILAYAYRYVYPLLILFIMTLCRESGDYLPASISLLAFSAYGLVGYWLRWRHIFCSFQNAYHQKMTPEQIDWSQVSKPDAYICPCFFAVCALLLLLL